MRHKLLCSLLILFFSSQAIAQIQKALIIGIDIYKPENAVTAASAGRANWMNLDGCVNDATAVRDLVVAKYGFLNANTTTLFNEQATRARIISELKKLASEAKKGDVIFVYYAGHGSQVYNSLSPETDKKDESIVPSDSYKGAVDIRDKELAALFNLILDKGALLTVIFDSCHSGSIGRGFINEPPKMRFIEESRTDAKDDYVPVRPETRNALILSAAQDFEFAKEQRDENNIPHGAFTIALLKALQQLSPDASVSNIFTSITSIMKYYGKTQEPVLAANDLRKAG
ncbi:MAG TPA: caspase family protein, partial [Flavisolibacter sp.]|nr:caspase family protein [Flavisolibacter sp.]